MVYSEVVKAGLILPAKNKYTLKDVYSLLNDSLFNPLNGKTLSITEAAFIVKCSAICHGTEYSKTVSEITDFKNRKYLLI